MAVTVRNKIEILKANIRLGVIPAMATPLRSDGQSIDESGIRSLVDFLIDAGVRGLFVGGTTGEGILLSEASRIRLHECAMDAIGSRVPALIHIGANTSSRSIRLTQHAVEIKADALVAVTPYFYPIHNEALVDYYRSLAEVAPEIPLFAYDIPQMAINSIAPELIAPLLDNVPSFAGLKSSRPDAQLVAVLWTRLLGRR